MQGEEDVNISLNQTQDVSIYQMVQQNRSIT